MEKKNIWVEKKNISKEKKNIWMEILNISTQKKNISKEKKNISMEKKNIWVEIFFFSIQKNIFCMEIFLCGIQIIGFSRRTVKLNRNILSFADDRHHLLKNFGQIQFARVNDNRIIGNR